MTHPYDALVFRPSSPSYVPPPEPDWWLGPGLLPPGGKLIVSALTKVGKSWFAVELTRALCTCTAVGGPGGPWAGRKPARVLYLDRELGEWSFANRWRNYDALRAIGDDLIVMPLRKKMVLDSLMERRRMIEYIKKERINVLVVDPVNRFVTGPITDNEVVGQFIDGVDAILDACTAHGLAAVLIAHNNKPTKPSGNQAAPDPHDIYSMQGGANWVNYSDSVVTVAREKRQHDLDPATGNRFWDVTVEAVQRHGEPPDKFVLQIMPAAQPPVVLKPVAAPAKRFASSDIKPRHADV